MQCWEHMKCENFKICPAYPNSGLDCWKRTGTKCAGGVLEKATFNEKIVHCRACDFYQKYAHKY